MRSSAPGYTGGDKPHTIKAMDAGYLRGNRVHCVISFNHCAMDGEGKERLRKAGIAFFNFKIVDFAAPTSEQLNEVADLIEFYRSKGGATSLFCGYGEGRTGTFVAAWAILMYMRQNKVANISELCRFSPLKENFGVETMAQADAVRAVMGLEACVTEPAAYPSAPTFPVIGAPSFPPPGFFCSSAPSGISLPDDTNNGGMGLFANFGGPSSGSSPLPPGG